MFIGIRKKFWLKTQKFKDIIDKLEIGKSLVFRRRKVPDLVFCVLKYVY